MFLLSASFLVVVSSVVCWRGCCWPLLLSYDDAVLLSSSWLAGAAHGDDCGGLSCSWALLKFCVFGNSASVMQVPFLLRIDGYLLSSLPVFALGRSFLLMS